MAESQEREARWEEERGRLRSERDAEAAAAAAMFKRLEALVGGQQENQAELRLALDHNARRAAEAERLRDLNATLNLQAPLQPARCCGPDWRRISRSGVRTGVERKCGRRKCRELEAGAETERGRGGTQSQRELTGAGCR